jgi:hypothetical protein
VCQHAQMERTSCTLPCAVLLLLLIMMATNELCCSPLYKPLTFLDALQASRGAGA